MPSDRKQASYDTSPIAKARAFEPELKRVLYSLFERSHATKAALYLAVTHLEEGAYELVTSFAYNAGNRQTIDPKDPLLARLLTRPGSVAVNSLLYADDLAEVLFLQGTERMLAIPMFGRTRRMIGFIDLRDRAGKLPFDENDLTEAEEVADELVQLLGTRNVYGLGAISLVAEPKSEKPAPIPPNAEAPAFTPLAAPVELDPNAPLSPRAHEAIRAARAKMGKRGLVRESRQLILTASELERVRPLLPAALGIPGAIAVMLTNASSRQQVILAAGAVDSSAVQAMQNGLASWMKQSLEPMRIAHQSLHLALPPVTADRVRLTANAPLAAQAAEGVFLTVAFENPANELTKSCFGAVVERLSEAVQTAIDRTGASARRTAIAEKLLEPDFEQCASLADHCRTVSGVAQRFATTIGIAATEVETIRIAALVHDVGLRLLDYDRLSGRTRISAEHLRAVAEHPLIGAALVEPVLGSDVAEAVLRHHERFDGSGYPGRLAGNRIPISARVLQIADAWVSMTSPESYLASITPGDAINRIRKDAGTHFDPALVGMFLASLPQIAD